MPYARRAFEATGARSAGWRAANRCRYRAATGTGITARLATSSTVRPAGSSCSARRIARSVRASSGVATSKSAATGAGGEGGTAVSRPPRRDPSSGAAELTPSRAPAARRSAPKIWSGSESLRTQPIAPASTARRADGASANALSISTVGRGRHADSSRTSAIASWPGIEKSCRTTWGWRVRVTSSAASGWLTAPTSSQNGRDSSSWLSPIRTASLSSTISVRTRGEEGADAAPPPAAGRLNMSGVRATSCRVPSTTWSPQATMVVRLDHRPETVQVSAGFAQRSAHGRGARREVGLQALEQLGPPGLHVDRAPHALEGGVHVAAVGRRQAGPEDQLVIAGRELGGAGVAHRRLLVVATADEVVALGRQAIRIGDVEHALELVERLGVVLYAQVGGHPPRLAVGRRDGDCRRLAPAHVAAGFLGRPKRRDEPPGERPLGRLEAARHRRPHVGARHHVRLDAVAVARLVAGERDAALPRVHRHASGRVDDRDLT